MDLNAETEIEAAAGAEAEDMAGAQASEAVEAGSPPETDGGSASSAEAVDTRTHAEIARDEFLKKYGVEEEPAKAAEPEPEPKEETTERKEGAPAKVRLSDDEMKALPPRAQQRIKELSLEIHEARETTAAELAAAREDREAMQRLRAFTADANLSGQDVANTLALAKDFAAGRFEPFLAAVLPLVQQAQMALGQTVAPGIQSMVDSGEITPEAAKRLTQAEQREALAQQTAARERQRNEARTEQEVHSAHLNALANAARQTEIALRAEDPDFALKEPAIRAHLGMLLEGGRVPDSAAEVERLIRSIHQNVMVQRPAAVTPTRTQPAASTTTRPQPAPRNTLEAITRAAQDWPQPR